MKMRGIWKELCERYNGKIPQHKILKLETFDIVIAPKESKKSSAWTRGERHRDIHGQNKEECFSYTVIIFLVNVTAENGTVRLWPRSAEHTGDIDPKHPQCWIRVGL